MYQFYYDFITNDKSCCNVMMQYICNGLNSQYMADCIESFQWENWVGYKGHGDERNVIYSEIYTKPMKYVIIKQTIEI